MIENYLKKIHLIQEFDMNFSIDKDRFVDNLKSEVNITRTKAERFFDNFSEDKIYLNASFKENSIRLMLEPNLLLRKHFLNQYFFNCEIKEKENDIQLKCKVYSSNKLFYFYVLCWLASIPLMFLYFLFTSEFLIILIGMPSFIFFLALFFLIEYIPLVMLKNNGILVLKKAYNKSLLESKG